LSYLFNDTSFFSYKPLCPITGSHGEAKQLSKMLKSEINGWKLIENGTCMNMMKMRAPFASLDSGSAMRMFML